MDLIRGLKAEFVPLREFPRRRWFYATPLWYYHGSGPREKVQTDRNFYDLIDPLLREACYSLHRAGIDTTPSCQGHFYPLGYFKEVWGRLQGERQQIQHQGLPVRDCETGRVYLFREAEFRLPWDSFGDFYQAVASRQNEGYLGIQFPAAHRKLAERLVADAYRTNTGRIVAGSGEDAGDCFSFSLVTAPPDPQQAERDWSHMTAYLRGLLRK